MTAAKTGEPPRFTAWELAEATEPGQTTNHTNAVQSARFGASVKAMVTS